MSIIGPCVADNVVLTTEQNERPKSQGYMVSCAGCEVDCALRHVKSELSKKLRIASVWIRHIQNMGVLKCIFTAEHIDNWKLHVVSTTEIFYLFMATGRNINGQSAAENG
jgi:hypothetical protein